jgi:hypothetical protein
MTRTRVTVAVIAAAMCWGGACSDTATTPSPSDISRSQVVPLCTTGCTDVDPYPDSAGVFLGSGTTPATCTDGTDADQDGLEDFCETNLSQAFAPELRYWDADEVGREPHLAVRPLDAGADSARIAYLISYYRDSGSSTWWCSLPFAPSSCNGHNGDSEVIYLDVYYRPLTQHWVLSRAQYSQHDGIATFTRGSSSYPTALQYPSHPGAYPRSWVAEGKHGNYESQVACNSGGTLGTDTCVDVNTSARIVAGASLNIGSSAHHTSAQDCMPSSDPTYIYYGSGRLECYWTNTAFRGWVPTWIGGAASDAYAPKLSSQGF